MNLLFKLADEYLAENVSFSANISIEELLGQIVLNRITGIAFDNMELSEIHPEGKKVLNFIKERNLKLYKYFLSNLEYLLDVFCDMSFDYALLKGAYITPFLYKAGHRTSNDIDVLVSSENVSKVQKLLSDHGFIQGYIKSGRILPATRKQIIESKMNYGETVPFLKQMDENILEVDINFSLDFKPSQDKQIIAQMLSHSTEIEKDNIRFKVLRFDDFLIHLCCHLYKEATTYDWVLTRRDLMLYKFSDINVFVHKHGNEKYFDRLIERIRYFRLEKECYYTFENAAIIYPNLNKIEGFVKAKETIRPSNLAFMTQIIWPRERSCFGIT